MNGGVLNSETPFGGFGDSGHGRVKGLEALYGYTQLKTISYGSAGRENWRGRSGDGEGR